MWPLVPALWDLLFCIQFTHYLHDCCKPQSIIFTLHFLLFKLQSIHPCKIAAPSLWSFLLHFSVLSLAPFYCFWNAETRTVQSIQTTGIKCCDTTAKWCPVSSFQGLLMPNILLTFWVTDTQWANGFRQLSRIMQSSSCSDATASCEFFILNDYSLDTCPYIYLQWSDSCIDSCHLFPAELSGEQLFCLNGLKVEFLKFSMPVSMFSWGKHLKQFVHQCNSEKNVFQAHIWKILVMPLDKSQ